MSDLLEEAGQAKGLVSGIAQREENPFYPAYVDPNPGSSRPDCNRVSFLDLRGSARQVASSCCQPCSRCVSSSAGTVTGSIHSQAYHDRRRLHCFAFGYVTFSRRPVQSILEIFGWHASYEGLLQALGDPAQGQCYRHGVAGAFGDDRRGDLWSCSGKPEGARAAGAFAALYCSLY